MLSEFLKRLIFARQFDMLDGNIEILDIKHAMFPINVLKQMNRFEDKNSYEIFRKGIKEDMKHYSLALGLSADGFLKNITSIFSIMGLGKLSIVDINNKKKTAILKVQNPDFKDNYTKDDKICHTIIAGTLAGIFSFIFDDDVHCKEVQCMAFGYEYCEFVVKKEFK